MGIGRVTDEADAGGPEFAAGFVCARDFLAEGFGEGSVDAGEVDAHFLERFTADEGGDAAALEEGVRSFFPGRYGELGGILIRLEGFDDGGLESAEVGFGFVGEGGGHGGF